MILRRIAVSTRREAGRAVFLDGLVLGAMVGAAIAGSTLWSRWQASRRSPAQPTVRPDHPSGDGPPPPTLASHGSRPHLPD